MPNYQGHLAGGVVTYAVLRTALHSLHPSIFTSAEWLFFTLIGSLFPDIDTKSKGQKLFYRFTLLFFIILLIQQNVSTVAWLSIAAFFPLMVKHRGITHSLWFISVLCLAAIALSLFFLPQHSTIIVFDTLFFYMGALSHLVLDRGLLRTFHIR